jgi:uncharacterized membrane protein
VTLHALAIHSRLSDPRIMAALGPHGSWLAQRIFIPSSLATLVAGILLTIEGPWSFDQLWILLGLGGFAATFLLGIGLIEPGAKKLTQAIETQGPTSAEAARLDRRLEALGWVDIALLFTIVWDMALKPTADDVGTLLVAALVLAAAVVYAVRTYRSSEGAPATV